MLVPANARTPDLPLAERNRRLIEAAADRCLGAGYRRIALYGAGRHTLPIVRQPWQSRDIRVVAILDDHATEPSLRGVPIVRPERLAEAIDAVVVSSDAHERVIYDRAIARFGARGIPVLRIYAAPHAGWEEDESLLARLVERWGLCECDARWLVENRAERHDATLPMLPPERTELHLRRYEFAAGLALGRRVLDAACGTGYGSALLISQGLAGSVTGVDIDPRAVDYAMRRFGRTGARYRTASAVETGLPDASVDLVVSFETIEHIPDPAALVEEFARVLSPRGTLVLSTPNDGGLSDHHVQSFTRESLAAVLGRRFGDLRWFGQSPDLPTIAPPAAGIEPLDSAGRYRPTLLVTATLA